MSCCAASGLLVGSRPVVEGEFRDAPVPPAEEGDLTDPSQVTVITRDPSGAQLTYTSPNAAITNPSIGIWLFEFPSPVTLAGTWWVYMRGNSGVQAASQIRLKFKGANVAV